MRPPARWTRRSVLKMGATGAALGLIGARGLAGYDTDAYGDLAVLSAKAAAILAAVVETVLPPAADRAPARIAAHVRAIDAFLVTADPSDVAQLHALLYGVEHLTLPLGGHLRRMTSLGPAGRADVLASWQTSRVGQLRLGARSLVTLVFLAYYRTPEAFAAIGYSGPVVPGYAGPDESRARYDALIAPPGREPSW